MRSLTTLAAVSAASVALLLGSAATASAQSTVIDDKRYDVYLDDGTRATGGTYAQRVAASNIDVDKLTVNHGTNFVSIRVAAHKLGVDSLVTGNVRVNGGGDADFEVWFQPGPGGTVEGGTRTAGEESSDDTFCSTGGGAGSITGSTKTGPGGFLQLYVPRSCFDNPKSLRLGLSANYNDFKGTDEDYLDPISSVYFGAPEYTRWLVRG